MIQRDEDISMASRDYWFTVTSFLQQNWALIDPAETGVTIWFLGDASGVFDQLAFGTAVEAERALRRNGFWRVWPGSTCGGWRLVRHRGGLIASFSR